MVRLHSTRTFQHTQLEHKVFAARLADIKTLYSTLFFVYRQKLQKKATHSFVFMFISQEARLTTRLNTQTHTLTSSRQRQKARQWFRQDVAHVYHIRQAFPNSRLLADIRSTSGSLSDSLSCCLASGSLTLIFHTSQLQSQVGMLLQRPPTTEPCLRFDLVQRLTLY